MKPQKFPFRGLVLNECKGECNRTPMCTKLFRSKFYMDRQELRVLPTCALWISRGFLPPKLLIQPHPQALNGFQCCFREKLIPCISANSLSQYLSKRVALTFDIISSQGRKYRFSSTRRPNSKVTPGKNMSVYFINSWICSSPNNLFSTKCIYIYKLKEQVFSKFLFQKSEQILSQINKNKNPSSLFSNPQNSEIPSHIHAHTISSITKAENKAQTSTELMEEVSLN